jgi:uncharacterized phage-associated protein
MMDVYTLVKLIYILDRETYKRWGYAVTFDDYASLPFGPVPSKTYDLLKFETENEWAKHLHRKGSMVVLSDFDYMTNKRHSKLSRAIKALIIELYQKYANLSFDQLVKITHNYPEYEDPQGSSRYIVVETLLRAAVRDSETEVQLILQKFRGRAAHEKMSSLYA